MEPKDNLVKKMGQLLIDISQQNEEIIRLLRKIAKESGGDVDPK